MDIEGVKKNLFPFAFKLVTLDAVVVTARAERASERAGVSPVSPSDCVFYRKCDDRYKLAKP